VCVKLAAIPYQGTTSVVPRDRPSVPSALAAVGPKNQGLKALDQKPLRSAPLKACPYAQTAVFTQALYPPPGEVNSPLPGKLTHYPQR